MHRATDFDSRQARTSFGFTLVELLVVIGIIGMLVALLLPAVMSAQEQARQTQCAKQMKDLASANLAYAMKKGRFPGYNNSSGSWVIAILPYLDMQEMARSQEYKQDAIFYCPSNPPDSGTLPLSYRANAGMEDSGSNGEPDSKNKDPDVSPAPVSNQWTAVFQNGKGLGLEDIRDGKRNTLLLAEKASHSEWNGTTEVATGFTFDGSSSSSLDSAAKAFNNVGNTSDSHPSSFHQEGLNVAYCDGHTDFYFYETPDASSVDTVPYQQFRRLMTPAGAYNNAGEENSDEEYDTIYPNDGG